MGQGEIKIWVGVGGKKKTLILVITIIINFFLKDIFCWAFFYLKKTFCRVREGKKTSSST